MEPRGRRIRVPSDRARPEHLADNGRVLQQALLRVGQPVEAGGDDALERLGKRELVRRALLRIQLDELLGVERIAARPLEQGLLGFGREQRSAQEAPDQLCGLLVGQRGERKRRGVELAAAPARAAFEELGPRRRDDEQRDVRQPVDELVEEVEEALVRPVDVLDDDDERTLLGETLEEAAPGGEGLVSAIASQLCVAGEAEEREEMRLDARLVARAGERVLDDLVDLRRDVLRRVLLQNARLRLDDLAERPERDPVTVGKAASLAPGDELRVGIDDAIEFVDEPALADSGDADEREELRRALVTRSLECVSDDAELALAPDELRAGLVRDVDAEARSGRRSPATPGSAPTCPSPRPERLRRSRWRRGSPGRSSRRR